jgi:Ca2+-binding EF-hand superfamily protein
MVVAHKSSTEEIGMLRNIFERHVSHYDGAIWLDEFFSLMKGSKLSQDELSQIFDAIVST